MAKFWDVINKAGAILSILGGLAVIFGVAYYFYNLDARLNALDNQVRLLNTAPAITRPATPPTSDPGYTSYRDTKSLYSGDTVETVPNPLITTCVELIKRAASARESNNGAAAISLEGYMRDYGCADALKGKTK
jgi:hypothetical protein